MKAAQLVCALVLVATLPASSMAASSKPPAHESPTAVPTLKRLSPAVVVPLRVQRLLKKRAPRVAYVPTRLPPGFHYDHLENLSRSGFDLYFRGAPLRPLGFDALLVTTGPCAQGTAMKRFRIDGVVVLWNAGHNDQQAWRCLRRGQSPLLLTASTSSDWGTARQLAAVVASARPIAAPTRTSPPAWPQFHFGAAHTGATPYERSLTPANVARLQLAWTYETGGAVWSSPAVVRHVVYVGSNDGYLYALRFSDGSPKWKTALGGRASAPAVVAGVVYVVADDGFVYAFRATTGKRLWRAPFANAGAFPAAPTVADGIVYVMSTESLTALDARSGATRWQTSVGCFSCSVAVSHGVVYAAAAVQANTPVGGVFALAGRTGTRRWTTSHHAPSGVSPAVQDGVVYAADYLDNASGVRPWTIAAFKTTTGKKLWQTPIGQSRYLTFASPAVAGGRVIFPSPAGRLVALDAQTGRSDWRAPLAFSNSAPAIANGVVYVGSNDNYLHAFDARTGRELWGAATNDGVTSSPSVVNGTVLVGSDDGAVRAFRPSSGG